MRRGEVDAYQDPENETGLFAGVVYEADDEEADRIYAGVDDIWTGGGKREGEYWHCHSLAGT